MKHPKNWQICPLSIIATIYNGNSIAENTKAKEFTGLTNGYNYISTKDISMQAVINYENGIKIPQSRKGFKIAPKGSPLLCIEGGNAGKKLGLLTEDVCFGNKLCVFVSKIPNWIYLYLQSPTFKDLFNKSKNGLIGGVSINKIKQIIIPLPPLAEQKRIVKKIEELFAVIDKNIQKLEHTQQALIQYRQSVLQQAFSGKLYKTTNWTATTLQKVVNINPKTLIPKLADTESVSFLPMPSVHEESLNYV